MEEIKVNDYVRTKEGYIAKLIHYGINKGINGKSCLFDRAIRDISDLVYDEDNFLFDSELKQYIIKHSSNIIDLIEVGDIVIYSINCKMTDIEIVKEHTDARTLEKTLRVGLWSLEQVDIKQILTKEQFERESYSVEE